MSCVDVFKRHLDMVQRIWCSCSPGRDRQWLDLMVSEVFCNSGDSVTLGVLGFYYYAKAVAAENGLHLP